MATRNRAVDTENEYIGTTETLEVGDRPNIGETIEAPIPSDKMAFEAFMNEMVTIQVHQSSDENDAAMVEVGVNGRRQFIMRGVDQQVRRKFVAALARAKRSDYDQVTLDPRAGEQVNHLRHRQALRYPFQVTNDPNPKGPAWLRAVLASAN